MASTVSAGTAWQGCGSTVMVSRSMFRSVSDVLSVRSLPVHVLSERRPRTISWLAALGRGSVNQRQRTTGSARAFSWVCAAESKGEWAAHAMMACLDVMPAISNSPAVSSSCAVPPAPMPCTHTHDVGNVPPQFACAPIKNMAQLPAHADPTMALGCWGRTSMCACPAPETAPAPLRAVPSRLPIPES